jgi:indolepyruvate ferredoxin oxidoreductase
MALRADRSKASNHRAQTGESMTELAPGLADEAPIASLTDKYTRDDGEILLTGLQAIVRVAMDQMRADRRSGLRTASFISGYPGSPLGGLDQELERSSALLAPLDVVHQPGLNEELAATAVAGSQVAGKFLHLRYDGVVGMWYAKAPGLDRAADAIRHANYNGVPRKSGAVAWVGDDPACKSSTIPSSSEQSLADMYSPVLAPGTVQEVIDYGLHAVALSRVSSLWTGMKLVTAVADGMGTATVRPSRIGPILPGGGSAATGRDTTIDISFAARVAAEQEITEVRLPAALEYSRLNGLNEITADTSAAWLGIVVPSHTYYELLGAFGRLGLRPEDLAANGIRVLRMGMLFPFDYELVRSFARGLAEVLVVEERRPFLEPAVRNALYGERTTPSVVGKTDESGAPLVPAYGALDVDALVGPLRRRVEGRLGERLAPERPRRTHLPLAARAPYFCSGCPHSTGTKVPEGTVVGSGIGCHGMIGWMNPDTVGTVSSFTQMGGEGAQFIGIAPFVDEEHFTQNVGDGTFFHSGQLAVQAAVAAGLDVTFKILFNDTVAMTGGQDAQGRLAPPQIAEVLLSQGVARVAITTEDLGRYRGVSLPRGVQVRDRSQIVEVQEELNQVAGVTVLIHDQRCAAESRRMRKRGRLEDPPMRVAIVERVCEGCGDCSVQSNCMSVQPVDTEFGSKRTIDQTSCNKDYSCLAGDCPSFVTLLPARSGRLAHLWRSRRTGRAEPAQLVQPAREEIAADSLPAPTSAVTGDDYAVRMPGVGGTGVVTVSQVLVTAATLAGLEARSMDQTGLAQKGGPVVSDVRISRHATDRTAKIDDGGADLYLVFDPVVGALPGNLAATDPARTIAVVSTTMTPTGEEIGRPGAPTRAPGPLADAIGDSCRTDITRSVDAAEMCRRLFGNVTFANVFLLGVAYQLGALPVPAEAVEQALELNGVAVQANVQAFRWGRRWVVDPRVVGTAGPEERGALAPSLAEKVDSAFGSTPLADLVARRAADLSDYQSDRLAREYVHFVEHVAARGDQVRPGNTSLAEAVARNLHKLMAYKDEYEVARLLLEDGAAADLEAAASGRPMRAAWNLHPPILRTLGLKRKVRLGPWFRPALVALKASRRLRGTPLDVFGYAKVRRVERSLIGEYCDALDAAAQRLTDENYDAVAHLASLPDLVRGYESIKLRSIDAYRAELRTALDELNAAPGVNSLA